MNRPLIYSGRFSRAIKRLTKRDPELAEAVRRTLVLLADDAFQPSLESHKLKGRLAGSWACSAGFDLRITFEIVEDAGEEVILLESVGTHEDLYGS